MSYQVIALINLLLQQAGLLKVSSRQSAKEGGVFDSDGDSIGATWFGDAAGNAVDWSETRAFMPAPGCYGINFNMQGRYVDGCVSKSDIGGIEREIEDALGEIRDESNNVIFELRSRSEVYSGHCVHGAPDLLIIPNDWGWMAHCSLKGEIVGPATQNGVHYMQGVIGIRSNHINAELEETARMEDIAATILAVCGVPLCGGIEGRPLAGVKESGAGSGCKGC